MAIDNLQKSTERGVFIRTEPGRKNGVKLDRQFVLVYVLGGKKYRGIFGWESEGYRLSAAREKIDYFRKNFKADEGPLCLEDERQTKKKETRERQAAELTRIELESNRPTVDRLWVLYQESNPGIKGIASDRNRYDNYIKGMFGDKTPDQITTLDIDRLRIGMLNGKIGPVLKGEGKRPRPSKSPQTTKHALVLLRRILRFGESRKLCLASDLVFKMPRVDNQVTEHLTQDEVTRLLTALNNEKDQHAVAIVRLALLTGMRKGEILSLEWKNVDLDRLVIRLADPKGGKSILLPLSDSAAETLRDLPRTYDLVFPGRNGQRRHDIKRPIARIQKAAGLPPGFRPLHGLRHHFASELASSGEVDLYILQRLLGHKDPTTTMRYAHLRDETLRTATAVAAKALKASEPKTDLKVAGIPSL